MPATEKSHTAVPPIDAVITWVNGDDPQLKQKRESYLNPQYGRKHPGTQATRFASVNEIKYCVLSICKFAPFVRHIYIITDKQNPDIHEDIEQHFPGRSADIKIIDHTEIFRGHEEYLPTFNSISIEHMMWRIKNLSDIFLYLNDDFFLIRHTQPQDWVLNNRAVLRGYWLPSPQLRIIWDRFRTLFKPKNHSPRPSFHVTQWLSASLLGFKFRYFVSAHTPYVINKKALEQFYRQNDSLLRKNISYRFRDYNQFNIAALSNHLEIQDRNTNIRKPDLMYLQPHKRKAGYIEKRIKTIEQAEHIKFLCVQSLELCNKEDQDKVINWLERIMELKS